MKCWTAVAVALAALAIVWLTASAETTKEWLVTSDADAGPGTLRWAIEGANESPVDDVIRFDAPMTIRPRSALPSLTGEDIAIIGSREDPSPDAVPLIWIDGTGASDAAGLELRGSRGVVRGIGILAFDLYGIGVIGPEASGAVIEGNWIGLQQNGRTFANRLSGVAVIGGARGAQIRNNRIGGNSVLGRTGHGIVIGGGGSVDAEIEGNVIGIAPDGSAAPNDDGILIVDSAQATIRDNTIGFSKVAGIELRETRQEVLVDGNWIGVRRDGAAASNDVGVFLGPDSAGAKIGERGLNVIAANRVGIAVEQGAREALIENNWIGLVPARGVSRPGVSDLPQALIRPNQERGVSIIAGAAEIQVRDNFIAAGEVGILVAESITTRVRLTRNVVAGSRQKLTEAAIDVRSGTEITIGGESGFGNHICGARYGIRVANTEEPSIDSNAVGAGAATKVTFDSDRRMLWGIRLDDGVVGAKVRNNRIANIERAGISVLGDSSQDNSLIGVVSSTHSLPSNQFSRNGIDIDLGADGPTRNDPQDSDRGPNQLLNHPVIVSHEVEVRGAGSFRSTIRGTASPGSYVEIYVRDQAGERRVARSRRTSSSGIWTATTPEIPSGRLRALAVALAGATSEFSPPFIASQRVSLREGVNWFAWTGPETGIEEAITPLLRWVETVWVYQSSEGRWLGWSPSIPVDQNGHRGSLERLETGDVVRLQLTGRPPGDFFVPAGGGVPESNRVDLIQGFNSVTWLGRTVDSIEALDEIQAMQPGLIGSVEQWDGRSWQVIWPRLRGAWNPGLWTFPALWIRAIRDGELSLP